MTPVVELTVQMELDAVVEYVIVPVPLVEAVLDGVNAWVPEVFETGFKFVGDHVTTWGTAAIVNVTVTAELAAYVVVAAAVALILQVPRPV